MLISEFQQAGLTGIFIARGKYKNDRGLPFEPLRNSGRVMKESDLYVSLEAYFLKKGYNVQGEVCDCDLVAVKRDEIIIVELKKSFNVKLLYQAVRRLPITEKVYVAVFKPVARQKMSYWQMLKSLCRRLSIGLFVIDGNEVKLLVEPGAFNAKSSAAKKRKLLQEMQGRKASINLGGVTGKKLQTAYLESAVHIAVLLKKHKALSPADLKRLGTSKKTHSILYHNHYNWFQKNERGIYGLKPGVSRTIKREQPGIWEYYSKLISQES